MDEIMASGRHCRTMKPDTPPEQRSAQGGPAANAPPIPASALSGLKVIELGQLIAGPFAAKTLADFGADVIKIEPPGAGDPLRVWRMLKDGTSVWWQVQSRNKRSLALDLRTPEAQDIVRRLASDADVLIENFRPGAMESWGLGPDTLRALNPRLIMLRISGYGQTGPYRDKPGFGVVAEAMGGLRHLTGEPGQVPVRVGVSIGDTLAALHGVIGILIALANRQRTGQGQVIDVTRRSSTAWKACCPNTARSARCAGRQAAPCRASRQPMPILAWAKAIPPPSCWWPATATASFAV
jgi:formyl-CoA transferase